ncbi:sec-independent protein translocase protein TatC [Desulfobaculum bizertense DSM 18034]|uniref:Sec-independent protein translocase protein TatC n=2 Tax=Desulfobaculum TaxID=1433996 RepID=A0A1T4VKT2_9BACT|nr:twin-arginine translocase subunit TatC [Desulfobaculum bizertense]SKA65580.1 sec-independent protein translocase protein TatC [Desulfobaculum bizertense DSM 18034]
MSEKEQKSQERDVSTAPESSAKNISPEQTSSEPRPEHSEEMTPLDAAVAKTAAEAAGETPAESASEIEVPSSEESTVSQLEQDVTPEEHAQDVDAEPVESLDELDDPSAGALYEPVAELQDELDAAEEQASESPVEAAGSGGGDDGGDDSGTSAGAEDKEPEQGNEDGDDDDDDDDEELVEMGLLDHLEELRKRLTYCVIAVIVGLFACYGFAEQLFDFLMMPLKPILPEGSSLIFTGLPEGFFTYIKLSAFAGLFVVSPFIFYQLWAFIAPGLYKEERRWVFPIALCSSLFFVSGACFGYFVVFPIAFKFFMGFGTDIIKPMPSLKEYLSFSLKLLTAFGVAFELPLFIFFLARLGMVSSRWLKDKRKYFVLVAFVISAVLTPPDVVSQCFMAGPLIILYELGIIVAWLFGKAEPRKMKNAE